MPREIRSNAPGSLAVATFEEAPVLSGEIRVKTDFAAPKHGTETHGWNDAADKVPMYYDIECKCFLPQTPEMIERGKGRVFRPGNMWVGHVVEVGEGRYRVQRGRPARRLWTLTRKPHPDNPCGQSGRGRNQLGHPSGAGGYALAVGGAV